MNVVRPRAALARLLCFTAMAGAVTIPAMASPPANEATQLVIVNNNRRPAGALEGNILRLDLRAGRGVWHPAELGEIMRADDPGEVFARMQPRITFVMNGLSWPASERLTYRLGEKGRWRVINLSSQHHPMHLEITVLNPLGESTALHWHGMELDSVYDGVHGWSGAGRNLAPMIEPGGSFVVRFTPPRTGTFIYHTHLHDELQLPLGPTAR